MNSKNIAEQVFAFFIYVLVQVLVIRHFVLFDGWFSCYIYVGFILVLPFEIDRILLLIFAFLSGLAVDIFYDTLGVNTAACVMLAFCRPYIFNLVTPRGGYEENTVISLQNMGIEWFLPYTLTSVLIHHIVLFFVEAGRLSFFFNSLFKALCSTLFTTFLILVSQYLFYRKKR